MANPAAGGSLLGSGGSATVGPWSLCGQKALRLRERHALTEVCSGGMGQGAGGEGELWRRMELEEP